MTIHMDHVQPSTESEVWHIHCLSVEGCAVAFNTYRGSHCSVFLWPQDVAVLFEHEHFRRRWAEELADNPRVQPVPQAPDMMWLLNGIAVSCPVRAAHAACGHCGMSTGAKTVVMETVRGHAASVCVAVDWNLPGIPWGVL